MICLALSKHSACHCTKDGMTLDPLAYLTDQADIVARGLASAPAQTDTPAAGAQA